MKTTEMLRLPEVLELVPVSRSTWLRAVKAGTAPQPIRLSERVLMWKREEVESWLRGEWHSGK